MNANHQSTAKGNLATTETKLWLPPLSPKDQKKVDHLRKKSFAERIGVSGKTLWDWLQLLIIPVVLAGAAFWFNAQQTAQQNATNFQLAQLNNHFNAQLAGDQQQEAILQAYLDRMTDLIQNGKLPDSRPGTAIRALARAQTLTALRRFDAKRKGYLIRFLYESGLISSPYPIMSLEGANLRGADLSLADLRGVDLHNADLSDAIVFATNLSCLDSMRCSDLRGVDLYKANLNSVKLIGANLTCAEPYQCASVNYANLINADLSKADLRHAFLQGSNLRQASFYGADLKNADLDNTDLRGADLSDANLSGASLHDVNLGCFSDGEFTNCTDLTRANLHNVDLSCFNICINLSGANLNGANLNGANLSRTIMSCFNASTTVVTKGKQRDDVDSDSDEQ